MREPILQKSVCVSTDSSTLQEYQKSREITYQIFEDEEGDEEEEEEEDLELGQAEEREDRVHGPSQSRLASRSSSTAHPRKTFSLLFVFLVVFGCRLRFRSIEKKKMAEVEDERERKKPRASQTPEQGPLV